MQIETKRFKKPGTLLGVIVILFVLLFLWQYIRREMAQQFSKHSNTEVISVEQGQIKTEIWHPQISTVGSVKAIQGTDIGAVIDGVVGKIDFISGQMVKEGDPLVEYVNDDLKADVKSDTAAYELAKLKYQRSVRLFRSAGGISREDLDEAKAEMHETEASMEKSVALLQQSVLKAPFAGKLGLRKVSVGQFVAKGDPIVSLQQVDPIYIDFSLSENEISQVKVGDEITVTTSAYPDQIFKGIIIAHNADLNNSTRMLNFRAKVKNPNDLLMPGMFADVQVIIPLKTKELTVPEMAVNYSPFGDSIYKIVGDSVKQIYVKVGDQRGSRVAISGKIKAGDKIVTSGVFKLQNGSKIKIVEGPAVTSDQRPGDEASAKKIVKNVVQQKPMTMPTPKTNASQANSTSAKANTPSTNLLGYINKQLAQPKNTPSTKPTIDLHKHIKSHAQDLNFHQLQNKQGSN